MKALKDIRSVEKLPPGIIPKAFLPTKEYLILNSTETEQEPSNEDASGQKIRKFKSIVKHIKKWQKIHKSC